MKNRAVIAGLCLLVLSVGCASRSTTSLSSYPTTPAERELALAHSVPTNTPVGSIYEVKIYVVQPGDTVAKILERFRLTEEELASLNAGNHYRKIRVGERIVIFEQTSSAGENGWK